MPLLIGALAPILWGTTYFVTERWMPAGAELWCAFLRAAPVALFFMLISPVRPSFTALKLPLLLGVLNIGVFFICLFIATFRLPGSLVAVLMATFPVVVMAIRALFLKTLPTIPQAIAGLAGFAGIYLLLASGIQSLDTIGLLAAFVSIISIAVATVIAQHYGTPENMLSFVGVQFAAGALFILPIAWFLNGPMPAMTVENWMAVGWLSIVNTGIGYLCWFYGLRHLGATNMAMMSLLNPVVAILAGVFIMNETLGTTQLIGMGIILGSVALPYCKLPKTIIKFKNRCTPANTAS